MSKTFEISNRFQSVQLNPDDICYIRQDCRKIIVHYGSASNWEHSSMEEILSRIGNQDIVRCHHSLAVNLNHIISFYDDRALLLDSGKVILMCRAKWLLVKRAWEDKYYRDHYSS